MELLNVIARLDEQISDWQAKLKGYQADLEKIEPKIAKLERERDSNILAARVEGSTVAQRKLDEANDKLAALSRDRSEITVLIAEIIKKIQGLEAQKADSERKVKIFALEAQAEMRKALVSDIETRTLDLVRLLAQFKALGLEMAQGAKGLGLSRSDFYGGQITNFLHVRLSNVYPNDFQRLSSMREQFEHFAEADEAAIERQIRGL